MTPRHASSVHPWEACLFWCLTIGLVLLLGFFIWKTRRIHSEQAAHPMRVVTDSGALALPPMYVPGQGVPAGMKFVGSSQGKKYYPVGSVQGNNLKPENRIYFPSAAAAEAAGYVR